LRVPLFYPPNVVYILVFPLYQKPNITAKQKFEYSAWSIKICKKLLILSFLSDTPIISIIKIDTKLKSQLFPGKGMTL